MDEQFNWDLSDQEYDSDNDVDFNDSETEEIEDTVDREINTNIEIKTKKSVPVMTKYEKSNVISARMEQINSSKTFNHNGKKVLSIIQDEMITKGITSSFEIAKIEFDRGLLPPYKLIRKFHNGNYEVWRHEDFKYFPK